MTGSCPVSAHVCQETARERESLRRWKAEALPVLDGLQELGDVLRLPLGSQITGPEALTAAARLTRERDELRAEVERLRAGIEAIHHPEPFYDDPSATFCAHCQRTAGVWPCPTAALLNPTEGET